MPRGRRALDASLLEAALIGFVQMKRNVEEKMAEIPAAAQFGRRCTGHFTGPNTRAHPQCRCPQENGSRAAEEVGGGQSEIKAAETRGIEAHDECRGTEENSGGATEEIGVAESEAERLSDNGRPRVFGEKIGKSSVTICCYWVNGSYTTP